MTLAIGGTRGGAIGCHCIARFERLDGRINTWVMRDIDRAHCSIDWDVLICPVPPGWD
jgi:hypothetical protein